MRFLLNASPKFRHISLVHFLGLLTSSSGRRVSLTCFILFLGNMFLAFYHCCLFYNFVNHSFSVILKIQYSKYIIKLSVCISELNLALLLNQSVFSISSHFNFLFPSLTITSLYYIKIYPLHNNRTLELVHT